MVTFAGRISMNYIEAPGLRAEGASFERAPTPTFKGANLKGAFFQGAALDRADFSEARAAAIDLRGASLDRVIFEATDLTRADLRDTSLVEAI